MLPITMGEVFSHLSSCRYLYIYNGAVKVAEPCGTGQEIRYFLAIIPPGLDLTRFPFYSSKALRLLLQQPNPTSIDYYESLA